MAQHQPMQWTNEQVERVVAQRDSLLEEVTRLRTIMTERANHPHTDGGTRTILRNALGIPRASRARPDGVR